jgi:ABC-type transporter Mla subunit MlaD
MNSNALYVRVGLLLIVGAALVVGFVLFLGNAQFSKGQIYESYFRESVQGLSVGTEVKYRGVTLGAITDIGLTGQFYGGNMPVNPEDPLWQEVVVRYKVDITKLGRTTDLQSDIAAGLRARLASQGLTGLAYLELDFVPNPPRLQRPPWTPRFEVIPTVPSTYRRIQDAVQDLAERLSHLDFEAVVANLRALTDELRGEVKEADLAGTVTAARDLLNTVQQQIKQADLPGLTAQLRGVAKSAQDTLQGRQMHDILANTDAATAKLQPLLAQAQQTLQRTDATTSDVTASLNAILSDVQTAVGNLRDVTEELRRDPSQILFGAPPPRQQPSR